MRLFFCFLIACFFSLQSLSAQQSPPSPQDEQYYALMNYYYFHKDAAKIDGLLQWLQNKQILENNKDADEGNAAIAAFLSVLFADNPHEVKRWVENGKFTGQTKETIEHALWLSGNGKLITEIFKETPDFAKSNPVLLTDLPKRLEHLDMMLGAFAASGNTVYVKNIIDILDGGMPLTGDKTSDDLTRVAAAYSLGRKMMQHELVNRLVRKEASMRTGTVKAELEAIIADNIENTEHFPNKDGDFSAMLVIADEKALSEFAKPSNEGLFFKEISKAKRGDALAIKIVFGGMELTDDLSTDVTYDLKILDPSGDIYAGVDFKGAEVLKIKTPTRVGVFNNQSFVQIRFAPSDKLGKYKFVATLYDNVGKKTIPLTKEIELME